MLGIRWDNANITRMQSMMDSLDLVAHSAIINAEDLKKIMLVGKLRSIAVMLADNDILWNVCEHIVLTKIRKPWVLTKLRDIQPLVTDVIRVQAVKIFLEGFRVFFFLKINISVKNQNSYFLSSLL